MRLVFIIVTMIALFLPGCAQKREPSAQSGKHSTKEQQMDTGPVEPKAPLTDLLTFSSKGIALLHSKDLRVSLSPSLGRDIIYISQNDQIIGEIDVYKRSTGQQMAQMTLPPIEGGAQKIQRTIIGKKREGVLSPEVKIDGRLTQKEVYSFGHADRWFILLIDHPNKTNESMIRAMIESVTYNRPE